MPALGALLPSLAPTGLPSAHPPVFPLYCFDPCPLLINSQSHSPRREPLPSMPVALPEPAEEKQLWDGSPACHRRAHPLLSYTLPCDDLPAPKVSPTGSSHISGLLSPLSRPLRIGTHSTFLPDTPNFHSVDLCLWPQSLNPGLRYGTTGLSGAGFQTPTLPRYLTVGICVGASSEVPGSI